MVRKKVFRNPKLTSVNIEHWQATILDILGIPLSLVVQKGFEAIFHITFQGGKMRSEELKKILAAKRDELSTLEEQIRGIEDALSGQKSEEINEIVRASTKAEVMVEILQPIERYFRYLPEKDSEGLRTEAWDELAAKASEAARLPIKREDLIKYVRERYSEALSK